MSMKTGRFTHIEIVHPDPHGAAEFMKTVFGAEAAEDRIWSGIEGIGENGACEHVLAGGIVYQLIRPVPFLIGWQEHMDRHGPSTRCMCIHVDDMDEACDLMLANGAKLIDRHQISKTKLFDGVAEDDLNDCAWIDALEQCGMIFELQIKDYHWPSLTGYRTRFDQGRFMNFEIIHSNPKVAAKFLKQTLGAETVEEKVSAGMAAALGDGACERVLANGVVYQIIKPSKQLPGASTFMDAHGPFLRSCCVTVDNVDAAVERMLAKGCSLTGRQRISKNLIFNNVDANDHRTLDCAWVAAAAQAGVDFMLIPKDYHWPSLTGKFDFGF